ncbi:DUF1796 family putative cysteine peptidase [Mailhella massiliensis]|uniref:DUF1796 family putative cysteine peptidase n=1 Tax=Mailhella massiliensis TaxID=1903261 RepID=UPI0009FB80F2|nr:DUF1796 family putative cysteine peptidase [Mailhella massiliensis]
MICLSLGENCMPDMVIQRYGIKSYSTPFSFSRCNIFYSYQLFQTNFKNLINKEFLEKDNNCQFPQFYRNKKIFNTPEDGLFEKSCSNGFEFTHHNVVDKKNDRESFIRKINRLIDLKNSNDAVVFFYHHRYLYNSKIDKIIEYSNELINCFKYKNKYIVILEQIIVDSNIKRNIFYKRFGNTIIFFFLTTKEWKGKDKNILFAKNDEDLIQKMMFILHDELYDIDFPLCFPSYD